MYTSPFTCTPLAKARAFITIRTLAVEDHAHASRVQRVLPSQTTTQGMRLRKRHVDDFAARLTDEMLVGLRVAVITQRPMTRRHGPDGARLHEYIEISINGGQGEPRRLSSQPRMDLSCSRMDLRGLQPRQYAVPLTGPVAATGVAGLRGGSRHVRSLEGESRAASPKARNFLIFTSCGGHRRRATPNRGAARPH